MSHTFKGVDFEQAYSIGDDDSHKTGSTLITLLEESLKETIFQNLGKL
jgi:hypothetical protein